MTIDDADHYSEVQKEEIIKSYPKHERDARTKGIPAMGSGRVYAISEDEITIDPFTISPHWPRIIGMDMGYAHPTAAVMIAHDRDTDTQYVTAEYRKAEEVIAVHASSISKFGKYPVSWPSDVGSRDKTTGKSFKQIYKEAGLRMLPEHAQFSDGGVSVNAGCELILERLHEGRLKIFTNCRMLLSEIALYHRKDGVINKINDDLVDAMRYGIMQIRSAKSAKKGSKLDYSGIKVV